MSRQMWVQACGVAMLAIACAGAWAQGGLKVDGSEAAIAPPRLAARIALSSPAAWSGSSGVVLGDYYFERTRLGSGEVSGGFRATSGVLLGQRSSVLGNPAVAQDLWSATPYIGVGFSSQWPRRGWGFSADLGLAARAGGGGLRLGNGPTLDDLLRDLRLAPTLQLGVSYSF